MEERTIFQPPTSGSVRPGTRLNGVYEIEKLIAQGGMGEVYRGFNIQTHDIVAIKMIRPEFSDNPDVLELFRREASILHKLVHEAIVRYFVFSLDPDTRRAYLAMEFVDGPSLTKRLASGPLPLAEVKVLQRRIASALDAAHRMGIIHRDVSPDNIILPDGDVTRATIIDFGIARSLRVGAGTIIGGGFAGKYNYVSPEQLGLAGGDVTFKSDIYSFGLVLAEALCGEPIDMTGSQAEIIEKRRVVPNLSAVDKSIRPLIQAMLQPSPEKRPASMAAVANWGVVQRPGGAARRESAEKASSPRESGRTAAIAGAVIAAVSLGGATYVFRNDLTQWLRAPAAPPPPSISQAPKPPHPPVPASAGPAQPGLPPLAPTEIQTPPAGSQTATLQQDQTPGPTPNEAGGPSSPAPSPSLPIPQKQQVPTAEVLLDSMPPHASQPLVALPAATVGTAYRTDLPGFVDHGGKGLRLAADSLPEGLRFTDLGDGKGAVEGAPIHAGSAAIHVVATSHSGTTAEMTATLEVADKAEAPPPPSPAKAAPPPSIAASPPAQTAHGAETAPPEAPLKEARLEPTATPPASEKSDLKPQGPAQSAPSDDRVSRFVQGYRGGDCFLVKPLTGGGAPSYLGVGDELGPFQRFEEAFRKEVGADPQLSLRLITPSECLALDLIRSGPGEAAGAPRIELTDYTVGRNRPLAGKIANLGGRRAFLILVDNDGVAYRLELKPQADGDAATFSVPLTPDAGSAKKLQVILAIVSTKPISALETFRSGPLKALAPALLEEARNGSASVGAEYFTFAN